MNTEIRELTADELESVTGGLMPRGTIPGHLGPHSPGSTWGLSGDNNTKDPGGVLTGLGMIGLALLVL